MQSRKKYGNKQEHSTQGKWIMHAQNCIDTYGNIAQEISGNPALSVFQV